MSASLRAVIMKDPLVKYYLHQAGRGSDVSGIGPIYSVTPFVQRGHGKGSFLSGLFRIVRPVPWNVMKAVGSEGLRTGGNILSHIAHYTSPDVAPRDIIAKRVGESVEALVHKLSGRGRKRAATKPRRKTQPKTKKRNTTRVKRSTKRDIFS